MRPCKAHRRDVCSRAVGGSLRFFDGRQLRRFRAVPAPAHRRRRCLARMARAQPPLLRPPHSLPALYGVFEITCELERAE